MFRYLRVTLAAVAALAIGLAAGPSAASEELVDQANRVLENMKAVADFDTFRGSIRGAKGVLVIPNLLKAGFFFALEGGNGVLLARNKSGEWSHPAFYTLGAASIGLQIGVQNAQVVFVILTDAGLNAVIDSKVKLGFDGSVSAGTFGRGIEGSITLGLGGDIVAFSTSMGAFFGVAFEGAVIDERADLNRDYYGADAATARAILLDRTYANVQANVLRRTLAEY